jgi:mono/diheme cytochrome c family protein
MIGFVRGSGLLVLLAVVACGGGAAAEDPPAEEGAVGGAAAGLTPDQLENGIGPIREVALGPVDEDLVEAGEAIFTTKCTACHRLDERYVGPPLRGVTGRRTPAYVMNMMLNPGEMVQRHPVARELLGQYYTPMPAQDLTEADARALLEYLRDAAEEAGEGEKEAED